jgi:hypothetical protein
MTSCFASVAVKTWNQGKLAAYMRFEMVVGNQANLSAFSIAQQQK